MYVLDYFLQCDLFYGRIVFKVKQHVWMKKKRILHDSIPYVVACHSWVRVDPDATTRQSLLHFVLKI